MGPADRRSSVRMLARRRRHKDPCFANGRSVISPFLRGTRAPPSPDQKELHTMRSVTARLATLAAILVSLVVPAMASATATPTEISTALGKGVKYLEGRQTSSGEIAGFGGDWSLTSLAAAGKAPAEVNVSGVEGHDARSWYEGVVGAAGWPSGGLAT